MVKFSFQQNLTQTSVLRQFLANVVNILNVYRHIKLKDFIDVKRVICLSVSGFHQATNCHAARSRVTSHFASTPTLPTTCVRPATTAASPDRETGTSRRCRRNCGSRTCRTSPEMGTDLK